MLRKKNPTHFLQKKDLFHLLQKKQKSQIRLLQKEQEAFYNLSLHAFTNIRVKRKKCVMMCYLADVLEYLAYHRFFRTVLLRSLYPFIVSGYVRVYRVWPQSASKLTLPFPICPAVEFRLCYLNGNEVRCNTDLRLIPME